MGERNRKIPKKKFEHTALSLNSAEEKISYGKKMPEPPPSPSKSNDPSPIAVERSKCSIASAGLRSLIVYFYMTSLDILK